MGKNDLWMRSAAAVGVVLLLASAVSGEGQTQQAHRRATQQAQAQQAQAQQTGAQPFAIGDAVQIQGADGTWINGAVRSFDASTGKYEVVLSTGVSGWALPGVLRKASATAQTGVTPSAGVVAAPQMQGGGAPGGVCGQQPACMEVREFAAVVTEFRSSSANGWKVLDVGVQFLNKTNQMLGIVYVRGSGGVLDDQGNRFELNGENTIRGIGVMGGGGYDSKFTLQPGEKKDTRFEFVLRSGQQVIGTSFEVDLTTRILNAAGGGQFTLGSEYPLAFQGLGQTVVSTVQAPAGGAIVAQGAANGGQNFVAPADGAVATAPANGAVQPTAAAGAAAPAASTPASGKSKWLGMISQASGMIPGGGQSSNGTGAQGTAGGKGAAVLSQVQTLIPGFAANAGQGSSGVAGVASQVMAAIPGFSPTPSSSGGGTAAGIASQAATAIPGFGQTAAGGQAQVAPNAFSAAGAAPANAMGGAAPANAMGGASPANATAANIAVNACAGLPACSSAGAFSAVVGQLTGTSAGNQYVMLLHIMFRNASGAPLGLAYVPGSVVVTDNLGNRFSPVMANGTDTSVSGIPPIAGNQAPLVPAVVVGGSRSAGFRLVSSGALRGIGTSFNVSATVAEIDTSTGQARLLRQDRVNFGNVACSSCAAVPGAAAAKTATTNATNAAAKTTATSTNPVSGLLKKKTH